MPPGKSQDFVELRRELSQLQTMAPDRYRIYLSFSGNLERVILELPWESWAAREEYMAALAGAASDSFSERWTAVLIKSTREFEIAV